jgi:hypothetical protein
MNKNTRLVGEFVLIVVGVLVALMVETALENRKDQDLGDEYLARIKQDLQQDKNAIANRVEFFGDVQGFTNDVLAWLDTDQAVDHDLLVASFYAAEVWPFMPNLSTYQDLQSTGNIRLLHDIDLRTSLSAYYNKANMSITGWIPSEIYRAIIRGIIPNDVQELIRQNCPTTDDLDAVPTGFPPCELPGVDFGRLTELFEPLKTDHEFHRILTYRHSELGVSIHLLSTQADFADRVLEQIPDTP